MAKKKSVNKQKRVDDTLVAFILDKSGSMGSVAQATRSGFNEYVDNLLKTGGTYFMSLTLFDTVVDKRYVAEPLKKVAKLDENNYKPEGMTALYDAAMQTISAIEKSGDAEDKKVLCVIMTDGEENSSKEFTGNDLKAKIKELEKKGNWSFVFLGANQDAWIVGQKFGMSQMNTATYNSTAAGVGATMHAMSANTQAYAASASSQTQQFFTKKDQDDLQQTQ